MSFTSGVMEKKSESKGLRLTEDLETAVAKYALPASRNRPSQIMHMMRMSLILYEAFDGFDNLDYLKAEVFRLTGKDTSASNRLNDAKVQYQIPKPRKDNSK